jgi:hypothetical protein
VAGGEAEVVLSGEGCGLGHGALENGLGFGELLEVNQGVGAIGDEGGVVRVSAGERGVEWGGLIELAIAAIQMGEETAEVGVVGLGGVELFDEGNGFLRLALRVVEAG